MKYIILLISTVLAVNAYQSNYIPNSAHPTLPNHCLYKELELTIKEGESVDPPSSLKECTAFTCNPEGIVLKHSCPYYMVNENCKFVPEDLGKTYPDCCPHAVCNH